MKKELFAMAMTIFAVCFTAISTNGASGNVDTTFQTRIEHSGTIRRTAVQPDGKIIVVGNFGKFDENNRNNIARLNADGSFDASFNPGSGSNGNILRVLVQTDGKILICGQFTEFNSVSRLGLARLNADGSLDNSFIPPVNEIPTSLPTFYAIALQTDGKILVGGQILVTSGGNLFYNILRLNTDGSLDTSFRESATITSVGAILSIALQPDGKILASGNFVHRFVRLNSDGSLDSSFNSENWQPDGIIFEIKIQNDGKIVVGGDFARYFIQNNTLLDRKGIARLNANGNLDLSFSSGNIRYNTVNAIALQTDGKIIIGTEQTESKLVRLNSDGSPDNSFNDNRYINKGVYSATILADGKLLISGAFTRFSNLTGNPQVVYRNGIARLNADASPDASFNSGTGAVLTNSENTTVRAIKVQNDGKALIGGNFNLVNGKGRPNFALINADGTLAESFNPIYEIRGESSAANDFVYAVTTQPDGKILIGGLLGGYGNQSVQRILRFFPNGELDQTFQPVNSPIFPRALETQADGKIFAAGFDGVGNIVRFNNDGSIDNSFNAGSGANNLIYALKIQSDGKIIIGGDFTTFNGNPRQRIVRLNSNGTFDFNFLAGTSADGSVNSIAVQPDGQILIAGAFSNVRGVSRNGIARLTVEGSLDTSFNPAPGFNAFVSSIALQADSKIIAGGAFTMYNGNISQNVARLNPNGSLDNLFNAGSGVNSGAVVRTVGVQPNGKVVLGGDFTAFNNQNKLRLVRLQSGNDSRAQFDFDGDGGTDISIFRPTAGEWWYLKSSNGGNAVFQFGQSTDKLIPADFTGDGKTDVAFFRPSTGQWFVLRSEDSSFYAFPFGINGDIPAPADYDGDGKADVAVFRPSNSTWYISKSSGGTIIQQFGASGDIPAVGDYDGDGKSDIAIFRQSAAEWWILRSSAGLIAYQFGANSDKPVQGDFTGDGKTDIAVFRPSNGNWFVLRSEDNSFFAFPFGTVGDSPLSGDFDGDGKVDAGVFRPSNSTWYIQRTTAGTLIQQFGVAGDKPIPNIFVP